MVLTPGGKICADSLIAQSVFGKTDPRDLKGVRILFRHILRVRRHGVNHAFLGGDVATDTDYSGAVGWDP